MIVNILIGTGLGLVTASIILGVGNYRQSVCLWSSIIAGSLVMTGSILVLNNSIV